MIELTQENYYDKETDWQYLSFTYLKSFMQNPARAMADLRGEFLWFDDKHYNSIDDERPEAKALLIGNYIHSYFESPEAHQKFIDDNAKYLISSKGKTAGELKEGYKDADVMIERLLDEPLFVEELAGTERESIVTGYIGGQLFKAKIDALDVENGFFIDFKTVRTLVDDGATWNDDKKARVNFIIDRQYDMQMAIYKELLEQKYGRTFQPVIWAVSKEKSPLVKPYMFEDDVLENALRRAEDFAKVVAQYINGEKEPELVNDGSPFYNYAHRVKDAEDFEIIRFN